MTVYNMRCTTTDTAFATTTSGTAAATVIESAMYMACTSEDLCVLPSMSVKH
jgi:hypothetical protein